MSNRNSSEVPSGTPGLRLPRVDAVGILQLPADLEAPPRRFSKPVRIAALALVTLFAGMTLATGALSIGAYCLTTDGGDGRALRQLTTVQATASESASPAAASAGGSRSFP